MNLPTSTIQHGVFVNVYGIGTLLTGPSGIGKSELALTLIDRGHQLIADDAPEFFVHSTGMIIGRSTPALRHLLAVRGIGIVNIKQLLGATAVCEQQILSLIIELSTEPPQQEPGEPAYHEKILLNTTIHHTTLPFQVNRRNELLIETLVRHFQLKQAVLSETLI